MNLEWLLTAAILASAMAAISIWPRWQTEAGGYLARALSMATAVILPVWWVPVVVAVGFLPRGWSRDRPETPGYLWKVCTWLLAPIVAAATLQAARTWLTPRPAVGLLLALVAYLAAYAAMLHVSYRTSHRPAWRQHLAQRLLADTIALVLGGAAGLLYPLGALQPMLALGPVALLHLALTRVRGQHEAHIEPKTGLYNYRYLDQQLPRLVTETLASGVPVSVVFGDLDLLRDINNSYGHLAGDAAIRAVAAGLQAVARPGDIAARFGGEEYVLVMPGADKHTAVDTAERLWRRVRETPVTCEPHTFRITISLGVATCPTDAQDVETLIKAADDCVYRSKAGGRDRCTVYGEKEAVACAPCR